MHESKRATWGWSWIVHGVRLGLVNPVLPGEPTPPSDSDPSIGLCVVLPDYPQCLRWAAWADAAVGFSDWCRVPRQSHCQLLWRSASLLEIMDSGVHGGVVMSWLKGFLTDAKTKKNKPKEQKHVLLLWVQEVDKEIKDGVPSTNWIWHYSLQFKN